MNKAAVNHMDASSALITKYNDEIIRLRDTLAIMEDTEAIAEELA